LPLKPIEAFISNDKPTVPNCGNKKKRPIAKLRSNSSSQQEPIAKLRSNSSSRSDREVAIEVIVLKQIVRRVHSHVHRTSAGQIRLDSSDSIVTSHKIRFIPHNSYVQDLRLRTDPTATTVNSASNDSNNRSHSSLQEVYPTVEDKDGKVHHHCC